MKKLLCGLAMLLFAAGPLAADDDFEVASYQSVLQTLDNQDQELNDLRARLASLEAQEAVATPPAVVSSPCPSTVCPSATCCNPCIAGGGWTAGVGMYYLQPRWASNPAMGTVNPGHTQEVIHSFDFQGRGAPLVYVGYANQKGLGVRVQWFSYFNNHCDGTTAGVNAVNGVVDTPMIGFQSLSSAGIGNSLSTAAALGVMAIDLEATKAFVLGSGSYLISGGVRYAHIGQSYDAILNNAAGATTALLSAGHNFTGTGPTLAAQARYPFPFASSLGIYGRARGAALVGTQHADVQSELAGTPYSSTGRSNQVVPMSELEVGVDFNYTVRNMAFFAQCGFVVQSWFGVGNSANSTLIDQLGGAAPQSIADASALALYGLRTSAGVSF